MRTTTSGILSSTLVGGVLWAVLAVPALGQGSGSSRVGQPNNRQPPPNYRQPYALPIRPRPSVPRPPTTEEFARSLWVFLVRPQSPYTLWSPLPGRVGLRGVPGPHGPFARMYANAVAQGDPKGLPAGSILVLEDYTADQKRRTGINILYRVKGYDPRNGDWYWMKYLENGALVRTPPDGGNVPVAGRVTACIDCHRKAGGDDFVFSNDPTDRPEEAPPKKVEGEGKGKGRDKTEDAGKKDEGKDEEQGHAQATAPRPLLGRDWPASERVSIDAVDHRLWDALLKRHVDAKGRVDYAGWKGSADDVRALEDYLDALARADAERPAARAARLAYWINAYNALTVWGILRVYPTASAADRAKVGVGDARGRDLRLRVGGTSCSLDQIEHEILRKLNEPRIHFAIVCGARGCPPLLNEGYKPAELEGQLTRNSRAFFADRTRFDYDPERAQVRLSAILDWYGEDFGTDTAERLRRIAPYLPGEAARRLPEVLEADVSYQDYDQGLNDRSVVRDGDGLEGSAGDGPR